MNLCKHDEFCGGCTYQGTEYHQQLKIKENQVVNILEENGIKPQKMDSIEGCTEIYRYRNKMEYTFGDLVKDGEITLGMHQKGRFLSIVTVDQCQLVDDDFNKILRATLDFVKSKGYKKYDKKKHTGLCRNLIVRKGIRTGELLINIVTTSDDYGDASFDNDGFVQMIRQLESKLNNKVVGILRTINNDIADAVKPEQIILLYGRDYYNEQILDLKFKVSAFSFFQTNVEAVERLYTEALALIKDLKGKTVYDLYCGTGTISQILSKQAKEVYGIEIVSESVEAAKFNAKLNDIDNCNFIVGDVFEVLDSVFDETDKSLPNPDVIVLDPPRVGIHNKALHKIASYGVEQIVYISCNPKSLIENIKEFQGYGYKCEYLKPFDNFPMTKHIETIALISKIDK